MACILVVEDDFEYREAIELVLKMEGFEVQTAANGVEGLAELKRRRPDLILCDIMMPEMDGHQFLETLHNDDALAHIPLVFVTALDNRAEIRRGMSAGADDYLTKPFTADELVACVQGRIERARMLNTVRQELFDEHDLALLNKLTRREKEILLLVGTGATSKSIADTLKIRQNTVEVHRANMMRKLEVQNSAQLARWALMAEQS